MRKPRTQRDYWANTPARLSASKRAIQPQLQLVDAGALQTGEYIVRQRAEAFLQQTAQGVGLALGAPFAAFLPALHQAPLHALFHALLQPLPAYCSTEVT